MLEAKRDRAIESSSDGVIERETGTLALVSADVLIQDRLLSEVLAAFRALVRLLTRVDAQMLIQDRPLSEGPLAVDAGERLLIRVDPQVLSKV